MQQKVIRSHAGVDPLAGYAVVVYEQMGESGAEFRGIVKPGEPFRKQNSGLRGLVGRRGRQSYFAIAVNLASELRFSSSDHFKLDDHIHEFDLGFDLDYYVTDPEAVATARNSDPLRQLRDEIIKVIRPRIERAEWEEIRHSFRKLEKVVINAALDELQKYASKLGFGIKDIALRLRLPDILIEPDIKRAESEREVEKFQIEQEAARTKMAEASRTEDDERKRKQEIDKADKDHQAELRRRQLEIDDELMPLEDRAHKFDQRKKQREGVTDAIITATKNVAEHTQTSAELWEDFRVAKEIGDALTIAPNQVGNMPPRMLAGEADVHYLLANAERSIEILISALTEINGWSYPFEQKRILSSAILHLIAEALLDDYADKEVLKRYADKVFELSRQFSPPLSAQQNLFLEKFKKYEQLCEQLK